MPALRSGSNGVRLLAGSPATSRRRALPTANAWPTSAYLGGRVAVTVRPALDTESLSAPSPHLHDGRLSYEHRKEASRSASTTASSIAWAAPCPTAPRKACPTIYEPSRHRLRFIGGLCRRTVRALSPARTAISASRKSGQNVNRAKTAPPITRREATVRARETTATKGLSVRNRVLVVVRPSSDMTGQRRRSHRSSRQNVACGALAGRGSRLG